MTKFKLLKYMKRGKKTWGKRKDIIMSHALAKNVGEMR